MSVSAITRPAVGAVAAEGKHPRGLYVLFFTEMWERFSFYTVGGMWALYVMNGEQGFGWPRDRATSVWSWYLMFVYASPLIGGWLADRKLGYRKSVMLGGLFFMAGHALLAVRSVPVMYAALACLVIGNGFFKPNVSAMVGNLYPAFFVGAVGMVISVAILWRFRRHVLHADRKGTPADSLPAAAAVTEDAPPPGVSHQRAIDAI